MQEFLILHDTNNIDENGFSPVIRMYKKSKNNGWGGLDENLFQKGTIVNELPITQPIPNKSYKYLINPSTKKIIVEYFDYVYVPKETVDALEFKKMKKNMEQLTTVMDEAILNNEI